MNEQNKKFIYPLKVIFSYIVTMTFWVIFVDFDLFNIFTPNFALNMEQYKFHDIFFIVFTVFFIIALTNKYKNEILKVEKYSDIVFSLAPSAIVVINHDGSLVSANSSFLNLLGYNKEDITHLNYFNLLPKKYHEKILDSFKTNKSSINSPIQLRHKSGKFIDLLLKNRKTSQGSTIQNILFIDEVKLIKKLYKELAKKEEKFSKIFDFMPIGMELLNIETGQRIDVNKKLCLMSGYSYEEFMKSNFFTQKLWQNTKQREKALSLFIQDEKLVDFEAKFITKNGTTHTVLLNAVLYEHNNEKVALVAISDISEYKKLINTVKKVAYNYYYAYSKIQEQEFYADTLAIIADDFNADYVLITHIDNNSNDSSSNAIQMVETIANYHRKEIGPKFKYSLTGSPCEQVYRNNIVVVNEKVQQRFPNNPIFIDANIESYIGLPLFDLNKQAIGALVLLSSKKVKFSDFQINILQILSAKISNELNHKKNNNKLFLSEQHLKSYKEQAPLASIEWDLEFNVTGWNTAAEKMLGYSFTEIQQLDFVETFIPVEDKDKITKTCDSLIQGIGGEFSINNLITKQGKTIITEWHNQAIRDEKNIIIGATSIVINITEQQKAQSELINKEKDNQEILNTMNDAVLTINERGVVLSCNQATTDIFGYTKAQLLNENISILMPKSTATQHDNFIQKYLQTGQATIIGIGRELTAQKADGTKFPIRLSIAELSPNDKGERRFIGSCQDLTKIKQQQTLMDRFQKMDALGKLTGGVAHDFNNILGVVSGYGELLSRKLDNEPSLQNYSQQIIKASNRGAELTKKLLSFSSKKSINPELVNINKCILSIEDMIRKTLTVAVSIKMTLDNDLWLTKLALSAFEDSLLNLTINAKHAMPDGGNIIITTSNIRLSHYSAEQYHIAEGDYICISIEDNGSGMSKDVKKHLFDPFFTTKGALGTGLGLAQVYGFIQANKGGINVYSEEGKGTSFKLFLPRFKQTALDDKTQEKKSQYPTTINNESSKNSTIIKHSKTILMVDDETALTELARLMLESNGYDVLTANSAEQALKLLPQNNVALVVSDIIMPITNGYQLAEQIQQLYPRLPLVFASGFQGDNNKQKEKFAHIPLITKPYSEQALLSIIEQALKTKQNKQSKTLQLNTLQNDHIALEESMDEISSFFTDATSTTDTRLFTEKSTYLKENFVRLIQNHFQNEESFMAEHHYPFTQNHIAVHKIMINKLDDFTLIKDSEKVKNWIFEYFTPLFREHYQSMDAALKKFITENETNPQLSNDDS